VPDSADDDRIVDVVDQEARFAGDAAATVAVFDKSVCHSAADRGGRPVSATTPRMSRPPMGSNSWELHGVEIPREDQD